MYALLELAFFSSLSGTSQPVQSSRNFTWHQLIKRRAHMLVNSVIGTFHYYFFLHSWPLNLCFPSHFFQPWSLFWSACVWSNIGPWLLSLNVSLGLSYPVGMGQHRRLVWTNSFTECLKHTVCFWCTDPRGSAARMTQNWFPVSVINIIASRPLHITGDNLTGKEIHSPPGGRSAAAVP